MPTTRPVQQSQQALTNPSVRASNGAASNGSASNGAESNAAAAATKGPAAHAVPGAQPVPGTQRSQAKELRRQALLTAAASLFAKNGFNRVSLEDLGAAAGVSGPAVYRHFRGKQAVLGDLLLTVSRELLEGGLRVVAETTDPFTALRRLVAFQVDFALSKPDVIRVQDRDFSNLTEKDQAEVRTLQRNYVELWVEVLGRLHPATDAAELRMRAHATFGLINSTPHSVRSHGPKIAAKSARPVLESMALAALTTEASQAST